MFLLKLGEKEREGKSKACQQLARAKNIPGRRNSKCKGPEMGTKLTCLKKW